jgi:DmsE family decaheme c-type cytochrome
MKITRPLLYVLLLLSSLAWLPPAAAQSKPMPAATAYSEEGADTCLGCHDDESATYSASALFKTKHAARGDKRSPFGVGGLQCEACHGPGALHARNKKAASINTFKPDSKASLQERNAICMTCHEGSTRTAWHAGAHERAELACTDCHKVHRDHDPVLKKATEPQVCFTCHKQQRTDFLKTSSHPLRQGKMACSDCHNAHGSTSGAMLSKPTVNQTCFSCHAEKRGPVLWEHAPVAEDCALCHNPHGSARQALLVKAPPQLCQQCHSTAGHPSVARTSAGLPAQSGGSGTSAFVVGSSCVNCHTQVHGSNHPSGAKLMR